MCLVYRVISCDGFEGALGIVRWLPAYPKFVLHAVLQQKMSSFPQEIVKNIQAMESYRFLQ